MTNETVCIFPDTRPKDEKLFPLVQFFRQAVYIQPAENDIPAKEDLPPLAQELLELGQLRLACPAPLLSDGERFLSLVDELRQPGDHASRLASLFLSGLGQLDSVETGSAIVGALRRQNCRPALVAPGPTDERTRLLWQARLVLKLGELLDQQQQEIQHGLLKASLRESALLEQLREPDEEAPLAAVVTPQAGSTDSRMRLRLKAWRHLVALGSDPPAAQAFVATDRDAYELLLEECSQSHVAETRQPIALPLPAKWTGGALADRQHLFRLDAVGLVHELLGNPTASKETQELWERLLEQHYPSAKHGRCQLRLHFFAVGPQELLVERTGLFPLSSVRQDGTGTIMGFME